MWVCVARELETGVVRLMTAAHTGTIDCQRNERHNIPVTVDGDDIVFGMHRPDRLCPCRPRIIEDDAGDEIVSHREMVN